MRQYGYYPVGTVASFTCNPGYSRSGAEFRTCQANQTWSERTPTCTLSNHIKLLFLYTLSQHTKFMKCLNMNILLRNRTNYINIHNDKNIFHFFWQFFKYLSREKFKYFWKENYCPILWKILPNFWHGKNLYCVLLFTFASSSPINRLYLHRYYLCWAESAKYYNYLPTLWKWKLSSEHSGICWFLW